MRNHSIKSDIGLLKLGRELGRLHAIERAVAKAFADDDSLDADRALDAAIDACGRVADQIVATPAHTLDGLRVKARAFAWARSEDVITSDSFDGDTTDMCLAASIIRDLLGQSANPGTPPTA